MIYGESYESEKVLEERLIEQLVLEGYEKVEIKNIDDLKDNFRRQINRQNIERLNGNELSDKEFDKLLLNILNKSIFNSADNLRNLQTITRDDGSIVYIELLNKIDWCKNLFQVTHQTTVVGTYENRYDVTLLINGLPLVQIELKRRGKDFKEAFDQIERYRKHSYKDFYRYIQFFIISNGVDTKYFANGDGQLNFEHTFFWTDISNNRITNLEDFTTYFLPKCNVSKMIAKYMVIDKTTKSLMIMKPYQVYAVEKLLDRATETNNNAYVWHTTGSGKTLTSFKLSQLLSNESNVEKVFFLVDRKDLDTQTLDEFNRFEPDSVDTTDSTVKLIEHITDPTKKLILTTIQKMANACKLERYKTIIDRFIDKKVVFIIDECHRSQFGDMHKTINKRFPRAQYFGFTGTPRFPINPSQDGRTTADIFEKLLHNYLIKDAIKDNNVLGFSVDYVKTINRNFKEEDDTKVEAIDTDEAIMDDVRISNIVKNILKIHDNKTRNRMYSAIFTVKRIEMLIKYYNEFKKHDHDLKIAAIFTYGQNEDSEGKDEHSRDFLEKAIKDYNAMFNTNYSTNTYNQYFKDVSNKVKASTIDILLVVDMFLTGFDAKMVNTLYVDKRLKYHNLIQAFSRTNRVESRTKPYGNIVCYQTTKKAVDEAVKLYSQTNSVDVVLMEDYSVYLAEFKRVLGFLRRQAPTPEEAICAGDEVETRKFVLIFRELIGILVKLETFIDFKFTVEDIGISKQEFEDYRSKYLMLSRQRGVDKASILNEIDFCIELIRNDKINVHYILTLIKNIDFKNEAKQKKDIEEILKLVDSAVDKELRLKAELIKNFINRIVPTLDENSSVDEEFDKFKDSERENEIKEVSERYGIPIEMMNDYIGEYEFGGIVPVNKIKSNLSIDVVNREKENNNIPTVMKARNLIVENIKSFIVNLINKFI